MSVIFTGMGGGLVSHVKIYTRKPVDDNWEVPPTNAPNFINYGASTPAIALAINADGTAFSTNTSNVLHDFRRTESSPVHLGTIDGQTISPNDWPGGVAISDDGNRMYAGDPANLRYFIYTRPNRSTAWTRTMQSGGTVNSSFGSSISCSSDGLAVAVGLPRYTGSQTYTGLAQVISTSPGVPSGSLPTPFPNSTAIPNYGKLVAISGDGKTCAVVGGGNNLGPAWIQVFVVNPAGTAWVTQGSPLGWDLGAARFPTGIAISRDGNVLAVSGVRENTGSRFAGRVSVYQRTGTSWTNHQNIQGQDSTSHLGDEVTMNGAGTIMMATSSSGVTVYVRQTTAQHFARAQSLGGSEGWYVRMSRDGGWAISSHNASNNLFIWKAGV